MKLPEQSDTNLAAAVEALEAAHAGAKRAMGRAADVVDDLTRGRQRDDLSEASYEHVAAIGELQAAMRRMLDLSVPEGCVPHVSRALGRVAELQEHAHELLPGLELLQSGSWDAGMERVHAALPELPPLPHVRLWCVDGGTKARALRTVRAAMAETRGVIARLPGLLADDSAMLKLPAARQAMCALSTVECGAELRMVRNALGSSVFLAVPEWPAVDGDAPQLFRDVLDALERAAGVLEANVEAPAFVSAAPPDRGARRRDAKGREGELVAMFVDDMHLLGSTDEAVAARLGWSRSTLRDVIGRILDRDPGDGGCRLLASHVAERDRQAELRRAASRAAARGAARRPKRGRGRDGADLAELGVVGR